MEDIEEIDDRDFLNEGRDLSDMNYVGRTPLEQAIDEKTDTVSFMQIDLDYYTPEFNKIPKYVPVKKDMEYAVVRIFGVNA
jgi:hypothetical protein